MQKIHFIEFEWYKENILYYMYVFTFAKYSNTRLWNYSRRVIIINYWDYNYWIFDSHNLIMK